MCIALQLHWRQGESLRIYLLSKWTKWLLETSDTDRMGVATRLPPKYATCGKKTYFRVGEVSLAYVPRSFDMTCCSFDWHAVWHLADAKEVFFPQVAYLGGRRVATPILSVWARCSPRFLSFRHGAIKPFIFAQRDILHFLEGRKLKHRTSEVSSNHFVPFEEK